MATNSEEREGSVILNKDDISFDSRGRILIENKEIISQLREFLENDRLISFSGLKKEGTNYICPDTLNAYCPAKDKLAQSARDTE